jgi:uncharacterized protein (DUF885 family)
MDKTILAFLLAVCAFPAANGAPPGASSPSVESRVDAQNKLFEEYYQAELKAHPERATAYGDYRYNDRLDEYSLGAINSQHTGDQAFLERLEAISTDGLSEQDTLSHEVLRSTLRQRIRNYDFKEYEMPVNQMDGPHLRLADLPLAAPFDSVKQYEDYIARLHQIPRVFTQTAPEERRRLTQAITDTVANEVLPAYTAFAAFIAADYAPHGRSILSIASLPGGTQRYRNDIRSRTTVSNLAPAEIHAIGLKEIDRIQADMLTIARKEGFADLASFRASLETNAKYKATSAEQIVDVFRKYVAQMQPKLPDLFTFIPGSPVTVEAMPDFQSANATHYQTGTPDGKRPGRIVVAVANFTQRSLIDDEEFGSRNSWANPPRQTSLAGSCRVLHNSE